MELVGWWMRVSPIFERNRTHVLMRGTMAHTSRARRLGLLQESPGVPLCRVFHFCSHSRVNSLGHMTTPGHMTLAASHDRAMSHDRPRVT